MNHSWLTLFFGLHCIADFYLQTELSAEKKKEDLWEVIKHSIKYSFPYILLLIPFKFSILHIEGLIFIITSHAVIDIWKFIIQTDIDYLEGTSRIFFLDQLLHILCLIIVTSFCFSGKWSESLYISNIPSNIELYVSIAIFLLVLLKPTNICLREFIRLIQLNQEKGSPQKDAIPLSDKQQSVKKQNNDKTGRTIGSLERLLIGIALIAQQYTAIGLVLTAKALARHENFKEKWFAEYFLIGTLFSMLFTVVSYICILYPILPAQ